MSSFSRRSSKFRIGYCSCKNYRLIFREFEACRKLREVHTRLGVLRWRSLDVGRPRSTSLSFWSEFEVSFDVIL